MAGNEDAVMRAGIEISEEQIRVQERVRALRADDSRFEALCALLEALSPYALGFSGGVDSTLLLAVTGALSEGSIAVTIDAPYIPRWEIEEARRYAARFGVVHRVIAMAVPEEISDNPPNRCYLCKYTVFEFIRNTALEYGVSAIIDGSNADDLGDLRPGLKALEALEVRSPLLMCGATKVDIRRWSAFLELPTAEKPAYACLLTRIPHGAPICPETLTRIESAERALFEMGFPAVRVRVHGGIARIEVPCERFLEMAEPGCAAAISDTLKALGFDYVTLDLSGYTMGGFTKAIAGAL